MPNGIKQEFTWSDVHEVPMRRFMQKWFQAMMSEQSVLNAAIVNSNPPYQLLASFGGGGRTAKME